MIGRIKWLVIIVIMDIVVVLIVTAAIEVTINYNHSAHQDANYPVSVPM